MLLFLVTFAAFLAAAAWGVFGPDRRHPDGQGTAILDLRLAFLTRATIHLFFLVALVVSGLALGLLVLLAGAVALLALEVPLAWLAVTRLRGRGTADAAGTDQRHAPGWRPSRLSSADHAE